MNTDFSIRLMKAFQAKGITRTELSIRSGVAKGDITHYLKGDYLPKQDKCYMLAKALDVDPGWLMTGVEQETEESHPIVIPDTELFRKLMENMTYEDLVIVTDAFNRTEKRMREKGMK